MNVSISPPAAAPLTHTHTLTKRIYSALLSDTKRPVYTDLTLITHIQQRTHTHPSMIFTLNEQSFKTAEMSSGTPLSNTSVINISSNADTDRMKIKRRKLANSY